MINTNKLLGVDGITGLKTGNLGANTYNLLYTAAVPVGPDIPPLNITGVVLSGPSRDSVNANVQSLIGSIRSNFRDVALATKGDGIGTFESAWGTSGTIVLADSASIFGWAETPIEVTTDTASPSSYSDGEAIGAVTWTMGPNSVPVPVLISGEAETPDAWWRLTHPTQLG